MRAGSTKNHGRRISRSFRCESFIADGIEQQLTPDVNATAADLTENFSDVALSSYRQFAPA